jgi:hypothetical protein
MLQKIIVCFAVAFFLLSSSTSVAQFSSFSGAESQALTPGDGDFAPAMGSAFAAKRLVRAKGLPKAWISSYSVRPDHAPEYSVTETSRVYSSSKYDVYQQMNVYRL